MKRSSDSATTPATSAPGDWESSVVSPSTFRTSPKLRPIARTASSTSVSCRIIGADCGSRKRLRVAPREKLSCTSPSKDDGAVFKRGTRVPPSRIASGSMSDAPRENAVGTAASKHSTGK
eukprot:4009456-Prymnesium_polylepis.1